MRMMVALLLCAAMLLGSPLAQAVECVMARSPEDAALAAMPADCPMVQMMSKAKHPSMSVADCVKAPALFQPEAVVACPVETSPSAVLPVAGVVLPSRPVVALAYARPPPDYGLARVHARSVVMATARLRP